MEKHTTELDLTKLYEAVRTTERLEYKAIDLCNEAIKLIARIMEVTKELKAAIDNVIDLKTLERSTAGDESANKDFYDPNKDSQHLAASL